MISRFPCVRGRDGLEVRWDCEGGGDEQTARRLAGPDDNESGVAPSTDRARFRGSMEVLGIGGRSG